MSAPPLLSSSTPKPGQQRWLLPALLVILMGALVVAGIVAWLEFPPLCGNDLLAEVVSPDGRWKAVQFRRDCGATTAYNTQVSLLRASESLGNTSGNLFVVGDDLPLNIRWSAPNRLQVSGFGHRTIYFQEASLKEVSVSYAPDSPAP